jgi:cytochrome c556
MCKLCWISLLAACVLIAAMVFKFVISGETIEAKDGRLSLQLEAGERDLVLEEMRMFLSTVQNIIDAANRNDSAAIVLAARSVGGAAQKAVPGSLMKKLPLEFKKLGFDTHSRFDQLALDAEEFGDSATSLKQLSELMQNCVGCHSAYRIDTVSVQ